VVAIADHLPLAPAERAVDGERQPDGQPVHAATSPPRLDRLDAYAGTYVDPFALGTIQVTHTGNSVTVSAPTIDANPIPLTPTRLDNFAAADGTPVTFIADPSGTYTYLYSRPFVAVRTAP
jgi:hypothetical protein